MATIAAVALGGPAVASATPAGTLNVSSVSSLKAGATTGTLTGVVANKGTRSKTARVTVNLMRRYTDHPLVGAVNVRVPAKGTAAYRVKVKLPAHLAKGNYYLAACTASGGGAGVLGCATAEKNVLVGGGISMTGPGVTLAKASKAETCTPGARTLSKPGMKVYPDTGNGGYTSVHSDVYDIYDAVNDKFLPGTHVDLTDTSTQCLSELSLDFEHSGWISPTLAVPGPNMSVDSVTINGQPATWRYAQPTYPGDPNGPDDPDPNAHAAGLNDTVSAANPLPPACTPDKSADVGLQCPSTKLIITPSTPVPSGTSFKITVNYEGQPGVHGDGDNTTEGWFKNPGDGGFVTTEPVGSMAWMPLNDHPSAKPTYDFYDTVTKGRQAIANGRLISSGDNAPDANFPGGSTSYHWMMDSPIASYLVENSMGAFTQYTKMPDSGVLYYEFQGSAITAAKMASNDAVISQQPAITNFEATLNGPFPFTSDGVIVGQPSASFEEEMETKITFAGGSASLSTLYHENMHQWWGDNVSESAYNLTFFKEGYAQMAQYDQTAQSAAIAAGGLGTPAGDAAYTASLNSRFNTNLTSTGTGWTVAPSNPTAANLFSSQTYVRPATAYIALRQILGPTNFNLASQEIQRTYGGGSITEPQEEAVFHKYMPNQSTPCSNKLNAFFTQWFDTAYATTSQHPTITGPGLNGGGFYDSKGGCSDYGGDYPTTVGAPVPAQLSLALGTPASFAPFIPGVAKDYTATTTATVISTAGDAKLSVTDPSSNAPGHLVNGAFSLPQALKAAATSPLGTGSSGTVSGSPLTVLTYSGPVSNDPATMTFTQSIGSNDALRTGTYSKTLTFTLSTTNP